MMRKISGIDLDVIKVSSGVRVIYFDGGFVRRKAAHRMRFGSIGEHYRSGHEWVPSSEMSVRDTRHYFYHCIVDDDDEATAFVVDIMGVTELPAVFTFHSGAVYPEGPPQWLGADVMHRSAIVQLPLPNLATAPSLSVPHDQGNNNFDSSKMNNISSALTQVLLAMQHTTGTRIFISGDRSQVGKSTTCLGLLAHLVESGFPPSHLAYIKPVTQCEQEQPITRYCKAVGIAEAPGPVIFYKGFTRAFLAGETPSSQELLDQAAAAVNAISRGKALTVVDGVGYPSVGSICGISNAHVAARLDVPVLLVGKSGVGDAVDSHNLNSTFFEHRGITVLGSVFNKLATSGFYSREACAAAVGSYFTKYKRNQDAYGFMPATQFSQEASNPNGILDFARHVQGMFHHVATGDVLQDAFHYSLPRATVSAYDASSTSNTTSSTSGSAFHGINTNKNKIKTPPSAHLMDASGPAAKRGRFLLSRAEIEAAATAKGAAGG